MTAPPSPMSATLTPIVQGDEQRRGDDLPWNRAVTV